MRSKNNYAPDVLDCLANLSNDEVFTPPVVVNQMLDMLPQEIFESKDTTFLDPFTKSGVFLREITKRLLEHQIPDYKLIADQIEYITKEAIQQAVVDGRLDRDDMDENEARKIGDAAIKAHPDANKFRNFEIDLQDALDHILQKQVFGIAITELTAQLARRSLYCSKDASGRYSVVGTVFGVNSDGNIRFEPMKHTWNPSNQDGTARQGASCIYCGASAASLDRPDDLESHAYEFIHKDIDEIRKELGNMEFTVVCGNPPYQLKVNESGKGLGAVPIYQKFVEQAKRLNPKYLTMIIPARWFSGGVGLNDFRKDMLSDKSISHLVDYTDSNDCFPGVDVNGGICYFLRNKDYSGQCNYTNITSGKITSEVRDLNEFNIFVRRNEAVSIIHKVQAKHERTLSDIGGCSPQTPYGFLSTYEGDAAMQLPTDCALLSSRGWSYVRRDDVKKYVDTIDYYKPMISKLSCEHAGNPDKNGMYRVLSRTELLEPSQICNQSYLVVCPSDSKAEADNTMLYLKTKFVRFLILQTLAGMNLSIANFSFVPWLDFTQTWTDTILYDRYGLTKDEQDYIESIIRDME